jgi:hypothetical protein
MEEQFQPKNTEELIKDPLENDLDNYAMGLKEQGVEEVPSHSLETTKEDGAQFNTSFFVILGIIILLGVLGIMILF